MAAQIPYTEPERINAGESIAWQRDLTDYPASAFTLKYALQKPGSPLITITATAAGTAHAVNVAPGTSADYAPGSYTWTAYVEGQDGSRAVVGRGGLTILPSPLSATSGTHATRTLTLIEAAIEGRIPNGLESTNIDGQELQRISIDRLVELHGLYQAKVAAEVRKASAAAGLGNGRAVFARFTAVR